MNNFQSFSELIDIQYNIYWAIGFFDGVHRGHRRVIQSAQNDGCLCGVLTFSPHPLAILNPARQPLLLTPDTAWKEKLIADLGADLLLTLPFDEHLAQMTASQFLDALCASCRVVGISVGANWHFGKGRTGNADFLTREAAKRGFAACVNPLFQMGKETVCSSHIRSLLSSGNIEAVQSFLGHPFTIVGTVEHGQHLARQLGFPTANISLPSHAALPLPGVYEVRSTLHGEPRRGIANVGFRPTIREERKLPRLEAHFPGWEGDLYGERLSVDLVRMIRPEKAFPSLHALQEQMARDLADFCHEK